MLHKCFNSDCSRELRYLRDGRVIRVISREGDKTLLHHYWLCGNCYDAYDFAFLAGGEVVLEPRSRAHTHKVHMDDVLLPQAS
jgi:hypothetical protein